MIGLALTPHKDRIRWLQVYVVRNRLITLESRCFYLEQDLTRLERAWPGATPDEQRQYRKQRMRLRATLEILKIDLASIEREVEEVQKQF